MKGWIPSELTHEFSQDLMRPVHAVFYGRTWSYVTGGTALLGVQVEGVDFLVHRNILLPKEPLEGGAEIQVEDLFKIVAEHGASCPSCDGNGYTEAPPCVVCDGSGEHECSCGDVHICEKCDGDSEAECRRCRGLGRTGQRYMSIDGVVFDTALLYRHLRYVSGKAQLHTEHTSVADKREQPLVLDGGDWIVVVMPVRYVDDVCVAWTSK